MNELDEKYNKIIEWIDEHIHNCTKNTNCIESEYQIKKSTRYVIDNHNLDIISISHLKFHHDIIQVIYKGCVFIVDSVDGDSWSINMRLKGNYTGSIIFYERVGRR